MSNAVTQYNPDNIAAAQRALQALGIISEPGESTFHRVKINGTNFEFGDEDVVPSNQKTRAPAFFGRIVGIEDYQSMYFDEDAAEEVGRPNIANSFCKSYHANPAQGGERAEDGTSCRQCPVMPFIKKGESPLADGRKCQIKADVLFQRTNELGEPLNDDTTTWTLSLPPTSLIELKGMRNKDQEKGHVNPTNFMFRLAAMAIEAYGDKMGVEQAVTYAGTMLKLGGVVAGFRVQQAKSGDGSRSYPVVVLDPANIIHVDPPEQVRNVTPQLDRGEHPEADDLDDLPF